MQHILILTVAVLLGACSTDAERALEENPDSERLIGTWKPMRLVAVRQDGTSHVLDSYKDCGERNRWTFAPSGRFSKEEFKENEQGSCEPNTAAASIETGSWALLEKERLSLFFSYTDGRKELFTPAIRFLDATTMRLSYEGAAPEMEYFYGEYVRVD